MTILVTGANGFVGRALVERLARNHTLDVRCAVRRVAPSQGCSTQFVAELDRTTDWRPALQGVQVVMHLAARVHMMKDAASDPLAEFRRVNVDGTMALARQAANAGVRRFVFVSSVKVNGDSGRFTEEDPLSPGDPYGVSKAEAEAGLNRLMAECGMEVVIVRPPLVYGVGVPGNFRALVDAVRRGVPLPFASVRNLRSLIGLENLADFLHLCATHPAAANQVFFVSDGQDVSTPALVRHLAAAMRKPVRVFPVPPVLLRAVADVLGQQPAAIRLLDSLQVDTAKARNLLGWTPPVALSEGLRRLVAASVRDSQ